MNITNLINEELEESIKKFGEDNSLVKMSRNLMKHFGYKVLAEINRLNDTAFTSIDDDDLSKQGFGNMLLNYLVDKDDKVYGEIHFSEFKAWNKVEEHLPRIHDKLIIVKKSDGKLDFAKYVEDAHWVNQDEQIIDNVTEWKSLYSITDL